MVTIRQETPFDIPAIRILNQKAFGGRDAEAMLVDDIRKSECFIPELLLVRELSTCAALTIPCYKVRRSVVKFLHTDTTYIGGSIRSLSATGML